MFIGLIVACVAMTGIIAHSIFTEKKESKEERAPLFKERQSQTPAEKLEPGTANGKIHVKFKAKHER